MPSKNPEQIANDDSIVVKGARVHNLKGISLEIPRDQLVVFTGPSGSGKSSLAFDTIYAEGQRRYVESLSVYARQFLERLSKPDVESISGLSPTISIDQKTVSYNPRSTVGTVTEIYDYFRLLFARIARPVCYNCKKPIQSQTPQQIVDQITALPSGAKIAILAPIVRERKGEHQKELLELRQKGFVRVRIDGEVFDLSDDIQIDKNRKHSIEVYVDRIILKDDPQSHAIRLSEAVELGLRLGGGLIVLEVQEGSKKTEQLFSEKFACTDCGINYPEPEPRTFSFNSPMGACQGCDGLGYIRDALAEDSTTEEEESIADNAVELKSNPVCSVCDGKRLRTESLHFMLAGKNIIDYCDLDVIALSEALRLLKLKPRELRIAERILHEINDRLRFLRNVGVGYLSLSRAAQTLSGGEAQRIRLATQIGSSLVGVTYVLDEPSIGLHPRDNRRLIQTLHRLRDLGNTVIVVEHDRETMEHSDWIVDLGPGAGDQGGEIIAAGSYADIAKSKKSITGKYLRGELVVPVPKVRRRSVSEKSILIEGARLNNLKDVTVEFPLGTFTCVTGVSGSGKSTLVIDTLYRLLMREIYGSTTDDLRIRKAHGLELVDKVIDIDQSPIGRTPRSNPATYTGVFKLVRDLFAQLPESQIRGYKSGRFSFNVKGGRCEACEGDGVKRVEMHFLPDVHVECDVCKGSRYNRETLDIRYKGKNIADVLSMTVEEAFHFFSAVPWLHQKLKTIRDVGLGYIHLGQKATSLSGGESQRIKLSRELSRTSTGKTIYILDEPSTGLHFDDVTKLVGILQALVAQGNTVIVIEHNLEIIAAADYIIDLGPEGGSGGGQIVATGSPEEVARNKESHTGAFLKSYLSQISDAQRH